MIKSFKELEEKHSELMKFIYVFSHDLLQDSKGFAKAYNLNQGVLAYHELLKTFHNPELPSVYISDRDGWLIDRYIKVKIDDFEKIDKLLTLITSH